MATVTVQGLVLAVEPDQHQAQVLARVITQRVKADFVVVDSRDAAIAALSARVPDVILLTALLSPRDEDEMVAHLRTLPGADHVQTHTIPQLASESPRPAELTSGGLLSKFRRKKEPAPMQGCDPALFADEVITFLARAAEIKAHAAPALITRSARVEAPLAGLEAEPPAAQDLTGDSSSWSSPFEWRRADAEAEGMGRAGEEEMPRDDGAERALEELQAAAERERARMEAAAIAEEQRLQVETEAAIEQERLQAEAEATVERQRQQREAEAAIEQERLQYEAEAAVERERLQVEAEAVAEQERQRLEAEAAAAERERLKVEAEAAAAAKQERLQVEAEAERERVRLEAVAAAERERRRLETEAAAERERLAAEAESLKRQLAREAAERERLLVEAAATSERERVRLEAEAASERERARTAAAAAERERRRLGIEAAAREEQHRLELAAERARAEAEAEAERERIRREVEDAVRTRAAAAAARKRERKERAAAATLDRDRRAAEAEAEARRQREAREQRIAAAAEESRRRDPFADFRASAETPGPLLALMPVAGWARPDQPRPSLRLQVAMPPRPGTATTADELTEMMAGLALPVPVGAVGYARGCRIRRVRVPAAAEPTPPLPAPVIVSRRALAEMRTAR